MTPLTLLDQASLRTRATFWRTLLTFSFTRLVIAAVLVLYLLLNLRKDIDPAFHALYWRTCVVYIVLAAGFLLPVLYFRRRFLLQVISQITLDIAVISILYTLAGGVRSGLAILYLFPLAGGAILAPVTWALFFSSLTALFMLGEAAYQASQMVAEPAFSQAGLYGGAYFAAVLVINRLAAKLIAEENLAAQRGIDLQLQQAINRLVIADMGDGILVVGDGGRILTANPAAERILGEAFMTDGGEEYLGGRPTLQPIADAYSAWKKPNAEVLAEHRNEVFVVIKPGMEAVLGAPTWSGRHELAMHLKLRFAKVDTGDVPVERSVIFLQDVTEIENQAQQLKLASMGRLTASIAHEVRNPLSAISYSASLMAEEDMPASHQRLTAIIRDNAERLNRMVEDILKLSRKAQVHHDPLDLALFVGELLEEFRNTHDLGAELIGVGGLEGCRVWFDPLHLREVLLNLLTNALRYASGEAGSIRIYALPLPPGRLELHVQDDGSPISAGVRAHLFEPFYTTSSKGTGLGLYLARELCLNNGAVIDYEYRLEEGLSRAEGMSGRFVITFAMAA